MNKTLNIAIDHIALHPKIRHRQSNDPNILLNLDALETHDDAQEHNIIENLSGAQAIKFLTQLCQVC